jgi:Fe-S cluster assembly ATP-binding protein
MGPNGAEKSTLASIIAGNENYEVTVERLFLMVKTRIIPEERAQRCVFLSFQYPVEIPSICNQLHQNSNQRNT